MMHLLYVSIYMSVNRSRLWTHLSIQDFRLWQNSHCNPWYRGEL